MEVDRYIPDFDTECMTDQQIEKVRAQLIRPEMLALGKMMIEHALDAADDVMCVMPAVTRSQIEFNLNAVLASEDRVRDALDGSSRVSQPRKYNTANQLLKATEELLRLALLKRALRWSDIHGVGVTVWNGCGCSSLEWEQSEMEYQRTLVKEAEEIIRR